MADILDTVAAQFDAMPWTRPFTLVIDVSSDDLVRWLSPLGSAQVEPGSAFGELPPDPVASSSPRASSRAGKRRTPKADSSAGLFDISQRQD